MKARDWIAAGVAGLGIVPSAVINVAPHLARAFESPQAFGVAVFQVVIVIVMGFAPFGIKRLESVGMKAASWVLIIVLLSVSFTNALDLANKARETATGTARGSISRATALNSRIADLRNSRAQLPQFKATTAASAKAAQDAVSEAVRARDLECGKVGPNCRKRTDEAALAQEKLSGILEQRGLTETAEKLDGDLRAAQLELAGLGNIPKFADPTSEQIARMISPLVRSTDDDVSEWRPVLFAFCVELLALLGPSILFAAIAGGAAKPHHPAIMEKPETSRRREVLSTAAPKMTAIAVNPATPAKAEKTKKIKPAAVAGVESVRDWFNNRVTSRPGNEIRVTEGAYDPYREWCGEQKIEPVKLRTFGAMMKGELGVVYVERRKRGYYSGIALKAVPLKIVANA